MTRQLAGPFFNGLLFMEEWLKMQATLSHVAGVDVHKEILVICALVEQPDGSILKESLQSSTMTEDLKESGQQLLALGIKNVAMESTGIYWKPVYNVWRRLGLIVTLGNAQHMKNVPGRKTDVSDAEWIAQLHRSGLIRPSYIPEEEFQQLRVLTRHRTYLVSDISKVKNRVQKVLEDGNIKLGSVISNVFGVAGLQVVRAIAKGITEATQLAALVQTNVKTNQEELRKSLSNCLTETHCFDLGSHLQQYDALQDCLAELDTKINERMQKYVDLIERLDEIPGIDKISAQVIIAEATTDMSHFRDDRLFSAWAGVAPGNNQSAKKKRKAKVRHGNRYFKRILGQAAKSASQKEGSYYQAKYRKLVMQTGSRMKAIIAIANRICRVIYHLISNQNERFKDLGWLRIDDPNAAAKRAIGKLRALGFTVNFDGLNTVAIAGALPSAR
jgi:transposase